MPRIQLVKLDPKIDETLVGDPAYLDAMMADDWPKVAELVHRLVGRKLTATPVSVDELAWDGYFVIDAQSRDVVGSCAFKGEPTADGTVEIAYFTYPGFEGEGYATAMAAKLCALAGTSPAVKLIIAHTLPEASASTRVLEKCGMTFVGEVNDPEDGRVWRWEKELAIVG